MRLLRSPRSDISPKGQSAKTFYYEGCEENMKSTKNFYSFTLYVLNDLFVNFVVNLFSDQGSAEKEN